MIKLNKTILIKCINQWNLFCYIVRCYQIIDWLVKN
jgi:hypothetical protein